MKYRFARAGMIAVLGIASASAGTGFSALAQGVEVSAATIVARVQKRAEDITSLSFTFEQTHTWADADRTSHITGTLKLKEPHFVRVEYPGQTIVSDGETAWRYLPRNNRVQLHTFVKEGDVYISPHTIFSRYVNVREPVLAGTEIVIGRVCDIVNLVAADPEADKITVWVDRELSLPIKTREEQANGDVTVHELSNITINPDLPRPLFTFKIPEGATVLDLRE